MAFETVKLNIYIDLIGLKLAKGPKPETRIKLVLLKASYRKDILNYQPKARFYSLCLTSVNSTFGGEEEKKA